MPVTLATRRHLAEDARMRQSDIEVLGEVTDAVQRLVLFLPDAARRVAHPRAHKAIQELQHAVECLIADDMPSIRLAMEHIERGDE